MTDQTKIELDVEQMKAELTKIREASLKKLDDTQTTIMQMLDEVEAIKGKSRQ